MTPWNLHHSYDRFPRVEERFNAELDASLRPRGPDLLFDLVAGMGLPAGAVALDVGCGEGRHAAELARRFGFAVTGVDPVPRHVSVARAAAGPGGPVFLPGSVEDLPVPDASVDLVWCRDVLVHVPDLPRAYAQFARVLRGGGRALVYQMCGTDLLEPAEARWLSATMGMAAHAADPAATEAAAAAAGLRLDERVEVGSEWGEWAAEHGGNPGRKLLHAARLRRDRRRWIARYGRANYELMLGDCLWHVYAMIGKLTRRVFLLTRP